MPLKNLACRQEKNQHVNVQSNLLRIGNCRGQSEGTVGRAFSLYMVDLVPTLVSFLPYHVVPEAGQEAIYECRAGSNP